MMLLYEGPAIAEQEGGSMSERGTKTPERVPAGLIRTDIPGGIERRRAPAPVRRVWSGREALTRMLRRPVIGLTLAGAAVPIFAATQATTDDGSDSASLEGLDANAADALTGENLEESIVERIAETNAERERESAVTLAMDRYGIARDLAEDIFDAAVAENIDPQIAYGLVKTESTFKERAVSPVGARGLTQVMPRTAAWMVPGTTANDLFDRHTNLRLGFKYLDKMIDKYKGNVRLALLAYNRGPGTVDRVLKQGGNPDNGYADKVLRG
jgi:soluble lytic murein transglycosylase-like protein